MRTVIAFLYDRTLAHRLHRRLRPRHLAPAPLRRTDPPGGCPLVRQHPRTGAMADRSRLPFEAPGRQHQPPLHLPERRVAGTLKTSTRTHTQPPPTQAPSIAATVGNGRFASLLKVRWGPRIISGSAFRSAFAISFTSAPAMKMPGFAERRSSALTSDRPARESRTRSNSFMTGVENLFTFSPGVSKTRTASPSPSTVSRKEESTSAGAVTGTISSTMLDITRPPRGSTRLARLRRRASRGRAPPCGGASRGEASG